MSFPGWKYLAFGLIVAFQGPCQQHLYRECHDAQSQPQPRHLAFAPQKDSPNPGLGSM